MPAAALKACGSNGLLSPYSPAALGDAAAAEAEAAQIENDSNPFAAAPAVRSDGKRSSGASGTVAASGGANFLQNALRSDAGAPACPPADLSSVSLCSHAAPKLTNECHISALMALYQISHGFRLLADLAHPCRMLRCSLRVIRHGGVTPAPVVVSKGLLRRKQPAVQAAGCPLRPAAGRDSTATAARRTAAGGRTLSAGAPAAARSQWRSPGRLSASCSACPASWAPPRWSLPAEWPASTATHPGRLARGQSSAEPHLHAAQKHMTYPFLVCLASSHGQSWSESATISPTDGNTPRDFAFCNRFGYSTGRAHPGDMSSHAAPFSNSITLPRY